LSNKVEDGLPFVEKGRKRGIIISIENPIAFKISAKDPSVIGK